MWGLELSGLGFYGEVSVSKFQPSLGLGGYGFDNVTVNFVWFVENAVCIPCPVNLNWRLHCSSRSQQLFIDPLVIQWPPFDPVTIYRPLGWSNWPLGVDIDHFENHWPKCLWKTGLVQVAYKNATAVAFHSVQWHKIQTFFKRVHVVSCRRQPVAQELAKIHVLHARKFCRPASGVGVLEPSRSSASTERVLVLYIRSV